MTNTRLPTRRAFPEQRVHHVLASHLHAEAVRLSSACQGLDDALAEELPIEAVRLSLLGLEGKTDPRRCLNPQRRSELDQLKIEGLRLTRRWCRVLRNQAVWRSCQTRSRRVPTVSLESLEGDAWMPAVELDGLLDAATYDELIGRPFGAAVLERLCKEGRVDKTRALVLTLDLLSGDPLSEVVAGVRAMGFRLPEFETLRRWVLREKKRQLPRLRELCEEIIGGPPADAARRTTGTSYQVPVVLRLTMTNFLLLSQFGGRLSILIVWMYSIPPHLAVRCQFHEGGFR